MSVVLACDLGGTSFRAALVDRNGETRAEYAIAGPTSRDRLGWSEIDPDAWWRAFAQATAALAEAEPVLFRAIEGVAICGVTRTQIFLGRDGQILRPAMTWRDARAERHLPALIDALPRAHPETAGVNAFHPLARLAWLKAEEDATFRGVATILDPKDYLNFRLTGARVSDPVSMARLVAATAPGADGRSLLDAIGASASIVPPLREPTDQVGRVVEGLPKPLNGLAGKPVFCCANDTWTAVVGLGALRAGYAYNISGTTEVLGVVSEEPASAEGLLTVDWGGLHQLGGPGQNGADTVAWLLALLGGDGASTGASIDALLRGKRDPQPLLFLPYLQGERTPYWDANLRGAFIGLNRNHGGVDLAWAVLEGIAFLNRIVLERAETALGRPVEEIRFGGGASTNPVWRQIKADICGRPVVAGASAQPGVLGSAAVAWTGLGRFPSLAAAQDALARVAHRHEPDMARAALYRPMFDLFRRSEAALAPVSRALAALACDPALAGALAPVALQTGNGPL